jgi:hypothetical protein
MNRYLFLAWLLAASSAANALDTNRLKEITGLSGTWSVEESVFKVTQPRADVKVSVDNWHLPPFMGLTSWAAFKPGPKDSAMVFGEFVLFQDEVNPVISVLLENGLEVTALRHHLFQDEPKAYFMGIRGEGAAERLAEGVKAALAKTKEIRTRNPQPIASLGSTQTMNSISAEALQKIFAATPEVKDGMAKFVFDRAAKLPSGAEAGKEMGVSNWAAFAGTDEKAIVTGHYACQEQELQPVLRSLRKSGLDITAIHQPMTFEHPRYVFLHFRGHGKAADLAHAIRLARGEQTKATAAMARQAGGFQEVSVSQYAKHRADGAVVLDVRGPEEFAKGHMPGAVNIDINAPGFAAKVEKFDKSKPILVNCHVGSRGGTSPT